MLPIILLSVNFIIVSLLEKKIINKQINKQRETNDHNIVKIPLENFNVMTSFKSSS